MRLVHLEGFQSYDPLAGLHPRLADAQYIVAREYGYSSWRKLTQRLDATAKRRSRIQPQHRH